MKLHNLFNFRHNNLNNSNIPSFNKNNENENRILSNYYNLNKKNKKSNLNINNKILLNNEKKIIKNNKTIYINKFIIKEKKTKIRTDIKNKRSSKFRGVSKNGNSWQVLMMFNNNKSYIGTYYTEEFAARIYDIVSIQRMGINAKTNFSYNSEQILRILKANINFKSPNISKINELIK